MHTSQIVVRITAGLAGEIARYAKRTGRRRSDIMREALQAYLRSDQRTEPRAAERVAQLLGSVDSGIPDLASNHRQHILESLRRAR
jgi:metal-responsive CopG/Arc/MetJ family transcriptional regulator